MIKDFMNDVKCLHTVYTLTFKYILNPLKIKEIEAPFSKAALLNIWALVFYFMFWWSTNSTTDNNRLCYMFI